MNRFILMFVGLLLWGGHYAPWHVVPLLVDKSGRLHRPFAYAYGCSCILAGYIAWAYVQAQVMPIVDVWTSVTFLANVMIAAGVGTMMPRVVGWIGEYLAMCKDLEDYEQTVAN